MPPVSSANLTGPPPAPHVNPAFFSPPPTHTQAPPPVVSFAVHVIGSSWVLSGDQVNSPYGVRVYVVSISVLFISLFIGIEEV